MRVDPKNIPVDPTTWRPIVPKEPEDVTPETLRQAWEKTQGAVAHERDQILERHERIVQASQERQRKERQKKLLDLEKKDQAERRHDRFETLAQEQQLSREAQDRRGERRRAEEDAALQESTPHRPSLITPGREGESVEGDQRRRRAHQEARDAAAKERDLPETPPRKGHRFWTF
ncbi:MAG TPA: hypothetical protein PK393_00640 [Synergistaceae bacterium]|nr:hypothetical protein [Synergistaceae bacterium]HQF90750.1 hypothetical protein [Synergistaceae bacterium]HQH77912.1 hypothetical protein [Synergistaceae bacterium]HQK24014.1 hypothetical protein [Synergistaceae bacterium]